MAKPANAKRGEVSLPGFGEGAYVRFTVDALECLESEYGEDWLMTVMDGLAKSRIGIMKTCIEVSINGGKTVKGDDGEVLDFSGMDNLEEVKDALYDALFLMLYGMTFEQKKAAEEKAQIEETKKKMQMLKDNPDLLEHFLPQFAQQGIAPDSDPTRSEDLLP